MEAALLQVYAPRDPIAEAIRGEISLRQLRLMIEYLPPDSMYHHVTQSPWRDHELLLLDIDSRLRDLVTLQSATYSALRAAHQLRGAWPQDPAYIEPPPVPEWDAADETADQRREAERAELDALMHRTN